MKKYDIFISYRRNSYDSANLIATRLRTAGYTVFFDLESMRSGKFNEQLYNVIDNCKDFILVLPPDALERCVNEDDWVRLEILRAMDKGKNIIPVMLNGFEWPSPMPNGLEELSHYQAITASPIEYFDMAMERLCARYLISRPHVPIKKLIKYASVVIICLFVFLALLWGIFLMLSKDICQKCATVVTQDASSVHVLAEVNERLSKDWEQFNREIDRTSDKDVVEHLKKSMLDCVDLAEKNIKAGWMSDSIEMDISPYQSFLLSLHGINAEEIKISPVLATMFYTDYIDNLNIIRGTIEAPTTYNRLCITALLESFGPQRNAYYAAILDELTDFPQSALETFHQLQPQWIYFPSEYKQGEESEYYENIINSENRKAEKIMSRFSGQLEQVDGKLSDLQLATEDMEREINEGYEKIENDIKKTNEAINTTNETMSQLNNINEQYIKSYGMLKKSCAFEANDDLWAKWNKMIKWGSFLAMDVKNRKELSAEGIQLTSSINPDVIYADMVSSLSVIRTIHPDTKGWIASAQLFYRDISMNKRPYAGVLIFGFKDNVEHPIFRIGDIVIKMDGKQVKNYDALKAEFKQNENAIVTFLRPNGNSLSEERCQMDKSDIIGFINLTD